MNPYESSSTGAPSNTPPAGEAGRDEQELDLSTLLASYLRYWPLYLLSLLLCLILGWLYITTSRPKYRVATTILFNDPQEGKRGNYASAIGDLDLVSIATGGLNLNVDNEMQLIQSREMLQQTIKESHYFLDFASRQGLRTQVYWRDLPVRITMEPFDQLDHIKAPLEYSLTSSSEGMILTDKGTGETKVVRKLPATEVTDYGIISFHKGDSAALKNKMPDELVITVHSPLAMAEQMTRGQISVERVEKNSNVSSLSILADNRKKGEDFLSKLVEVYNRMRAIDKNAVAQRQYDFINERISLISQELGSVESNLESVKKSQGVTSYEDLGVVVQSSAKLTEEVSRVQTQLKVVDHLISYVRAMGQSEYNLIPASLGVEDASLNSAVSQYNTMVLERNSLAASVSPEHPRLKALEKDLGTTRDDLVSVADVTRQGLQIQYDGLRGMKGSLQGKISQAPTFERITTDIERQRTIRSNLYLMLLTKREETSISLAASLESAKLVDPALADTAPSQPKKPIIYLAALILGLLLPTLFLYLRRLTRTKIRTEDDIRRHTTLSVLGSVPHISDDHFSEQTGEIVVKTRDSDVMTEIFRTLRTNLNFVTGNQRPLVLLATSTVPGEGKTFVASNLAVSLSALEEKVLMIGLDLRNPRLSRTFKGQHIHDRHDTTHDHTHGMSEILNDLTLDPMDYVIELPDFPGLSVLPAGKIPPNPAEMLSRPRLDEVIGILREHFDYIIIDSAPCGPVVDTVILSRVADATMYVTRYRKTDKRDLDYINYLSDAGKLPNVSIVLNDVKVDTKGLKNGYGYGYGYGYSSDGKKRKK